MVWVVCSAAHRSWPRDGGKAEDTKTVTANGRFRFHSDETLAKGGVAGGYVPISWREL
jgi:hypothetical protein